MAIPPMIVTFDDGTTLELAPRARDMVGAEATGHDFASGGAIRGMYAVAFATLNRLKARGELPDGVEVPDSFDEFLLGVDVESAEDDDPEGKD